MNKNGGRDAFLIKQMEDICFPGESWSLESVKSTIERSDVVYRVITDDCENSDNSVEAIGYYIAALSFEEAELYRIAVLPEYRGRGYGRALMTDFLKSCPDMIGKIFLEVRESNFEAVGLYEKTGFEIISRRKNYYGDEDGLIYCLTVG